ncbi:MAG: AlkZ family DNA glycosylase [Patulibacter sp.]|nr:AlkZ family DNA glycosylase [Patulibacter sp.]
MSTGPTLTLPELRRLRLLSQGFGREGLGGPDGDAASTVVDRLFALQGQDLPGALWSIGLRTPSGTLDDVRSAFDRGEIVRSWPFRGTLFALGAADLPWVLGLTAERSLRAFAKRRRELELDDATLAAAAGVAQDVLFGGRALGRQALLDAFAGAGIAVDGGRGYHLLWTLSLRGTIVLGPFDGNEQQFVLIDEWIPAPRRLDGDEALGELVRRYLTAHGPSPEADLAWWTKLPLRDLRRGIDVVRGELTTFDVGGVPHWAHAPTLDRVADEKPHATLLLPGFDEWVLGHGDRDPVVPREHAPRIVPGNNGVFKATVVHRGLVVGLWGKRALTRRTVVTATAFEGALPKAAVGGLERAARRYGHFLGTDVEVASAN